MADICEKVRFSIEFDSDTETDKTFMKNYDILPSDHNYIELLKWCDQLKLLSDREIRLLKTSKMHNGVKFKFIQEKIQAHFSATKYRQIKITFGNILTNFTWSDTNNLVEYIEEIKPGEQLDICEIKLSTKLATTTSALSVYPMRTKNRGVLFFINIRHFPHYSGTNRAGSEHDKFYLISLFRKFGYTVYYYENILLSTFWELVNQLINFHLIDTESLVFVVGSHGHENDKIEFYHGEVVHINEILFKFNDNLCTTMIGKPKIFLFPCCRGTKKDYGISSAIQLQCDSSTFSSPIFSDIMICYATISGYVTHRDIDFGSWYIEAFYRVLAQDAWRLDIDSMIYRINEMVQNICNDCMESNKQKIPNYREIFQTPACVRWDFNKLLYFNPGYVENDE